MRFEAIVRNGDFTRAYKKGKSYVHPLVVLYVNRNRAGKTRVGLTTSKKIGNAPQRSRARRVLRAALAQVVAGQTLPVDLVLVARGQTGAAKSGQVAAVLRGMFKKAGLPVQPAPPQQKQP